MENDWKKNLRREASAHHMCEENRESLSSVDSKEKAIDLYKKTIDWALEEGYPSFSTLVRDFSDCEDYGIYVNKVFHGEKLDEQKVYVFHNCRGTIYTGLNVPKRIIPMLYFANNCEMRIRPSGPSGVDVRVPLYVFGQNNLVTDRSNDVSFKIYNFEVK